MKRSRRGLWLERSALVLMGVYAAFLLLFAVGEMASGDISGAQHLVPVLIIIVLVILARRRPVAGGAALVAIGVLASVLYFVAVRGDVAFRVQAVLIGGAPFLVSGLLFLAAAALARRGQGGPA